MSGNLTELGRILVESLGPLENPDTNLHNTVKAISLVSSFFFLVSSLILNLSLLINICCAGKTSVGYFRLLIFYALFHIAFQVTDVYLDSREILTAWLNSSETLSWLETFIPILRRCFLGILFLLVATLTIERFVSAVVGGAVSICIQLITTLLALSLPALLAAAHTISIQRPSSTFSLDPEVWFGLEVGIYIILPLLVLTIFGTVNYCKISISSRLMPRHEVTAVKTNIGLVVLTNISIFIFLIQECLLLWLSQLNSRQLRDQAVTDMLEVVSVSELCVRLGLNLIQFIIVVLMSVLACSCSAACCCPSINQLEETRYKPVSRTAENVSL